MDYIKQDDTWPFLEFSVLDASGLPLDCTLLTVRIVSRNWKKEIIFDVEVGAVGSAAVWTDQALGQGEYRWLPADTANLGRFFYEFKFERNLDGRRFSLPQNGFLEYHVVEDVPDDTL